MTLWKRNSKGVTCPFDESDPVDFVIISTRFEKRLGQFIFPKSILLEKDVVSSKGMGGKRAIRVYPSWDTTDSSLAKKNQSWQSRYFFEIEPVCDHSKDLFSK